MTDKQLDIVIVGGSLSGLFAAVTLRRLGHSVRILERYQLESLKDQGAGLRIPRDVQDFLAEYIPTSEEYYVQTNSILILDQQGGDLYKAPVNLQSTSWGVLHRSLRSAFEGMTEGKGEFMFDCTLTSVADEGQSVKITYMSQGISHGTSADLVIGADGASSAIRRQLLPQIDRKYAGYVIWRGTVPESDLSSHSQQAFGESTCWYWDRGFTILAYVVPADERFGEAGKRVINWGWYNNYSSEELVDIMTDMDGKTHTTSLPIGKMRPEIAERQRSLARQILPPQFAELVAKSERPFLQSITDMISTQNSFFAGKILLVGDAVAGPRPHVGSSTSQAAFHVSRLKALVEGKITNDEWVKETMEVSSLFVEAGLELGSISQSPDLDSRAKFRKYFGGMLKLNQGVEAKLSAAKDRDNKIGTD